MNTTVEVIGIYPIELNKPVHLIEILIKNSEGVFDLTEITQAVPNQPKLNWQVPWEEKILDGAGERVIADCFAANEKPELWVGNVRMVFFFHNVDFSRPLITPFGRVTLPSESPMPNRLSEIAYGTPD